MLLLGSPPRTFLELDTYQVSLLKLRKKFLKKNMSLALENASITTPTKHLSIIKEVK